LPPAPPLTPPFDFDSGEASGDTHSGSLISLATNPHGWLGSGAFFPLILSEKSEAAIVRRASGGPKSPISTAT